MLGACTTWRPVPPVVPLPSDTAFAWPSVLDQAVDAGGRVDFQRLAATHGALDIAVAAIAQADLASMPGRAERLAFLVNASNTLWVYAVVRGGIPDRLGPLGRADLLRLARFDPETRRLASREWTGAIEAETAFQDGFPLLVASVAAGAW
mgnify:CR=1 FL=1